MAWITDHSIKAALCLKIQKRFNILLKPLSYIETCTQLSSTACGFIQTQLFDGRFQRIIDDKTQRIFYKPQSNLIPFYGFQKLTAIPVINLQHSR